MLEIYYTNRKNLENPDTPHGVIELLKKVFPLKGMEIKQVIKNNPHGKPFLEEYPDIHFSGSHSGDYVALAWSSTSVGLDLQIKDADKDVAAMVKRLMTKDETRNVLGLDPALQTEAFYRLWAQKESYMKYTGLGFALTMNSFSIEKENGSYYICEMGNKIRDLYLKQIPFNEDYAFWVCMEEDLKEIPTIKLD